MTKTESGRVGGWGSGLMRPLFWLGVALLVAADLWTKNLAWGFLRPNELTRPLVEGWDWLQITNVYNSGGVFGLFQGYTLPLTVFRSLAVIAIFWLLYRQPRENRLGVFTLTLLAAGALGNLYDNLSAYAPWPGNGEVRDFIMVDLGFWPIDPFPIFNVADSCISVGFVLLISGLARIQLGQAES